MFIESSGTVRAYGCLSASFSRLQRDIRRRGAFSSRLNSNGFALKASRENKRGLLDIKFGFHYTLFGFG